MDTPVRRRASFTHRLRDGSVWLAPVIIFAAALGLITGLASLASAELQLTTTEMLFNLVLVVGLYIFVGNSGILSFGHISFMAIGAYVTALFTIPEVTKTYLLPALPGFIGHTTLPDVAACAVAVAFAALVAALLGIPLMRLSGLAASLALFAVLLITRVVANNWTQVTRGRQTMLGIPAHTTMTRALVGAILAILVAYVFQESRVGLRLRAAREDEVAAKASGIGVIRERRMALIVSAGVVAGGGFLFAQFLGVFNPDAFYLDITFLTIAMLVIGGMNSLTGAVIGTVFISALLEILHRAEDGVTIGIRLNLPDGSSELVLAGVMLIVLIYRPRGITGGREINWLWRHYRAPVPTPSAPPAIPASIPLPTEPDSSSPIKAQAPFHKAP
jgi:branched-chain amino acid transport system permease protein